MEAGEFESAIATAKDVKAKTKAAAGALKLELLETDGYYYENPGDADKRRNGGVVAAAE
jgi:hypothetical protein